MLDSEFEIISIDDAGILVRDATSGHEFSFTVRRFEDGLPRASCNEAV